MQHALPARPACTTCLHDLPGPGVEHARPGHWEPMTSDVAVGLAEFATALRGSPATLEMDAGLLESFVVLWEATH